MGDYSTPLGSDGGVVLCHGFRSLRFLHRRLFFLKSPDNSEAGRFDYIEPCRFRTDKSFEKWAGRNFVNFFWSSIYCVFSNRSSFSTVNIKLGNIGESGRAFSRPKTLETGSYAITF